jgi:putative ABC transport system permease protein
MFKHYLTAALRYFGRNKFTTAINLLCLSMGMACFAVAYGVVAWFTNTDRHYANAERISFVTEKVDLRGVARPGAPSPMTSWVVGDLLRTELPQVPAIARLTPGGEAPIGFDDKNAFVSTAFADPEFLTIFDLPFVAGDAKAALQRPNSAIVTEAMAMRVFGRTDVVGKTLMLSNLERVAITGVVSAFKQPSHFGSGTALVQFEMLVSMDVYESFVKAKSTPIKVKEALGTWGANVGSFVYVLSSEDGSLPASTLNSLLDSVAKRHAPADEGEFHLASQPIWQLYSSLGDAVMGAQQTGISVTTMLLILGGLILLVSCVNYANLATAQVATRGKEVAMRRVVGAGRMEIIGQYLFETTLLAVAALAVVFVLALSILLVLNSLTGVNLLGAVLLSPTLWLMLVLTLCVVALAAGAYPALVLARVRPVQVLRAGKDASGPRFVSTVLVGLQFGAASFLLIAVLVMIAQNGALRQQRETIAGEPVLSISTSIRDAGVDIGVLRSELLRSEHIEIVAAADEVPGGLATGNHRMVGRSLDATAARHLVTTNSVDHEYFNALQIDVLAGRMFDPAQRDEWNQNTAQSSDVMNVVINRALAEQSGWTNPNDAIGQTMYGHAGLGEHALTMRVIGVVETRALAVLGFGSLANVYTLESERATRPIIRVSRQNVQEAVAHVEAVWKKLSPNVPLRRVFLDESFERSYRFIPMVSSAFAALALFAFLISAMGLIGMATHVTARRKREIGIRKTVGASVGRILGLLLRDFSKPVVIANLLMWPLGYVVMRAYLSMFMVQTSLSVAPFVIALVITAAIACASVALQATKAARLNPAVVLRTE